MQQHACYVLTLSLYTKHKENRAAEVVKALLFILEVETNPTNTWHLSSVVIVLIP